MGLSSPNTLREKVEWGQVAGFIGVHLLFLCEAFRAHWSLAWFGFGVAGILYRYLFYTIFVHRYFSHKAFRTSRVFQFVISFLANLTLIRGPLRFSAAHRRHHAQSDQAGDLHSPNRGFIQCYAGWLFLKESQEKNLGGVADLRQFPELVWMNRFYFLPTILLSLLLFVCGGETAVFWGVLFGIVLNWHLMFSNAWYFHLGEGTRPFATPDQSTNSILSAWIFFGEGLHNNHHQDMNRANLSRHPGEPDWGFQVLRGLEKVGLIWDLRD
jgi:stearoyl-CoA desaturase (delta-9 desaturase)